MNRDEKQEKNESYHMKFHHTIECLQCVMVNHLQQLLEPDSSLTVRAKQLASYHFTTGRDMEDKKYRISGYDYMQWVYYYISPFNLTPNIKVHNLSPSLSRSKSPAGNRVKNPHLP
jgi:hypothetical protein